MNTTSMNDKIWPLEYQMVCQVCRNLGFPKPSELSAHRHINKFRDYVDRYDPRDFGYPTGPEDI